MTTTPSQLHSPPGARSLGSFVRGLALVGALVVTAPIAQAQEADNPSTIDDASSRYPALLAPQAPLGLPGSRPRLSVSVPLSGPLTDRILGLEGLQGSRLDNDSSAQPGDRFSWSLRAWQLNTASLAHIQCSQHTLTLDTFLAKNCQFVDQPVPDNAVNLVQIQGEWTAAPNVNVGLGLFRSEQSDDQLSDQLGQPLDQLASLFGLPSATSATPAGVVEGAMANVSFGIEVERVGDFLVGLQLARYRQRSSLMDLGDPTDWAAAGRFDDQFTNAAQLNLAWQRGNFRGDLLGRYVDQPIRLGQLGDQTITAPPSGFDLEFSWRPGSASFSIGVSNVLDQSASSSKAATDNRTAEEGVRDIYGRIPYVRYKQDL